MNSYQVVLTLPYVEVGTLKGTLTRVVYVTASNKDGAEYEATQVLYGMRYMPGLRRYLRIKRLVKSE